MTLTHHDEQKREQRKGLYKGIFNYSGELFTEHTYAESILKAYTQMCEKIAKKKGVQAYSVRQHFFSNTHSWEIKEVKEDG